MERAEKLAVSSPAPPGPAAAPSPLPRFGPAAVLALQRSAGNAAVTARLSRTPAFSPEPVVGALRLAIDQARIKDRWTVDQDDKALHATARHVDLAAVVRELEVLTPEQIQLVKIRYQAEVLTTLENDLLGVGRSASPANLTDAEAERVYALLRGTGHKPGEEAPEALMDAVAAELHGLATGELGEAQRERLMALYRAHGAEMEPAYERHYGHVPAADLRGKLSARQQLRLDALREGDVARADALAIDDKRAAIDALDRRHAAGELSLVEPWYAKRRGELTEDAVALAGDSGHEAMDADPDTPSARAAHERLAGAPAEHTGVVAALAGGELIKAQALKLLDLEARHKTDTEHVEALMRELHDAAVHDALAGLPAAQRDALEHDRARRRALAAPTAERYVGLLAVMYDGLRPPGGRTWAAILASAKQPGMLAAAAAAGGELDPVDELHFAIGRKDAAAVRRVLDAHADHAQMVALNARYLGRYHLDLRHAVFGATGVQVALQPESPMLPSASVVRGHDAAAALERLDTPAPGGKAEVGWIVASAEAEVRAVKAGGGLAGRVLDTEAEQMMTVTLAHIRQLAARCGEHPPPETLDELRAARARLRIDAGGYEAALEHFRAQVRSAVMAAVQIALAHVPVVGEGIAGFLATTVINTSANALATRVIQGDAYDLDMLYDDVVGGLAGALGGKLGGEAVGLLKGGRAISKEALDLAAKQITGETAERAIALAKAAGRTSKLAGDAARASRWAAAGFKLAEHTASAGGSMLFTGIATGQDPFTQAGVIQTGVLSGVAHAAHADPRVVTDAGMRAGDAKVHYTAERPGAVEDVHVRVAPGTPQRVIDQHVATARRVQRFQGLSGVLNSLYERFITRNPAALPGTRAYEVRGELEKLRASVAGELQEIAAGGGDEAWVKNLADQIDHYRAELHDIEQHPDKGQEPGRGWIAALSPESFRQELGRGRPDLRERFDEVDAERFDRALATLEEAGLGGPGRKLIKDMFKRARRSQPIGKKRFEDVLAEIERVAELVAQHKEELSVQRLARRYESILAFAEDVVAAYDRGETIDGRPIQDRGSRRLANRMNAIGAALKKFNRSKSTDPVERLMALAKLQEEIARGMDTLRALAPTFSADPEILGDPHPSALIAGLHEQTVAVAATGDVSEPVPRLDREAALYSVGELAGLPTKPKGLAGALATLLAGYHRAHLVGAGFGGELGKGIMLAPSDVNLGAQNNGVELLVRTAAELGVELTVDVKATGRRLIVPLADGSVVNIDVLTKVEYKIMGLRKGVSVEIDVTGPPNGSAIVRTDVPSGAAGAEELITRLAPAQAGAIGRPSTSGSRKAGSRSRKR
jgi:hypothetical protein